MMNKNCNCCSRPFQEGKSIIISDGFILCSECAGKVEKAYRFLGINNDMEWKPEVSSKPDNPSAEDGNIFVESEKEILTPKKIKEQLDQYVIGQEDAKQILCVASYNHYKRIQLKDSTIQKSNVLLIGPTGCGKTHLVKTLAKILDVPIAITPATSLTEAGYIGNDAETVVENLLKAAGGDVEKAQRGIIFIDEIDKIVSHGNGARKEVGGTGVQQALLPIIEGTTLSISYTTNHKGGFSPNPKTVSIDTTNILFICGGAFPKLEEIINGRLNQKSAIGFSASVNRGGVTKEDLIEERDNTFASVTTDDLREFGLIPEFIGRLPVIATLRSLNVDVLRRILVEPKDAIVKQYQKLFQYDKILLVFEDVALDRIAQEARKKDTGARSLRTIMEKYLNNLMFELPGSSVSAVNITADYVTGVTAEPEYNYITEDVAYNKHTY